MTQNDWEQRFVSEKRRRASEQQRDSILRRMPW